MIKIKFKIVHLMIQEYDNVLSRNKVIFRKKYYEALEYHHQNQKREIQDKILMKDSFLVNDDSMLVLKEFETVS